MKTREAPSSRTAVVKNRKYYIKQTVQYIYVGTMAFFAKNIVSLFSVLLTEMFNGAAAGAVRSVAKLMFLIMYVFIFAIVELFFRRKVLDYKTVEE